MMYGRLGLAAMAALDYGRSIRLLSYLQPTPSAAPRFSAKYAPQRTRYMPHQGERECARRVRQMAKAAAHD